MHNAQLDGSERLRRTLSFIRDWGGLVRGVTSAEIQAHTGSMAVATDVSEIRRNGYDIECKYDHMSENGRKVFRYFYRGKKG